MKKMTLLLCILSCQLNWSAGNRRLSILAQRASAQVQNGLDQFSTRQQEALLKRYEEILEIVKGNIPDDSDGSGGLFYCDGGYINDLSGNDLDYISGGQQACQEAIKGIFYCDGGYINDQFGKDLDYISGGQKECLRAIKGRFYCDSGWLKNEKGESLDYISGGQEACIESLSHL